VVFHDIRIVTIIANELREKEATGKINLGKAMGKTGRKIAEKLTQFIRSGITIAIELDREK
jgi:hypothetical protein